MQHPAHRLLQLALTSFGFSAGKADGWWGEKTQGAAEALFSEGPARSSDWAIETLHRALSDLGYDAGDLRDGYSVALRASLGLAIDAQGAPAASVVTQSANLTPVKPVLRPVVHDAVMRHGSAGTIIRNLMMHTAATPASWWRGKSNASMLAEIKGWHANPVSKGGRGWSDIGYGGLIFPDGEFLLGRPLDRIGAGAMGNNRGWLHICMVPVVTINRMGNPEDFYTPEALATMRDRIEHYSHRTPIERLAGHNETAAKLCPGFRVIDRDWTDRAVA